MAIFLHLVRGSSLRTDTMQSPKTGILSNRVERWKEPASFIMLSNCWINQPWNCPTFRSFCLVTLWSVGECMVPGTADLFLPLRSFPACTLVNHCPCFPPVPEAVFKIIFQRGMFLCLSPHCGCVQLRFFPHLISANSALSYWVGSSLPLAYACNLPVSVIPLPHHVSPPPP